MTPKQVVERLTVIAAELQTAKSGGRRWKQLQAELDRLCGIEEKPRDPAAEAAWEKGRR